MTHAREPRPDRAAAPLPPWWSGDDDRPLVYVTFGSVAAGIGLFPSLYGRVLEQVADVPASVLLTLGPAGDPADLGPVPANVHVERWWPQHQVLPHAAAAVGHGGFGTTQAALEAGVPQVVLPLFSFDQFANADRVTAVGVGLALVDETAKEPRAGDLVPRAIAAADRLGAAVCAVLDLGDHRVRAAQLAQEVHELPDVDACVQQLAELR